MGAAHYNNLAQLAAHFAIFCAIMFIFVAFCFGITSIIDLIWRDIKDYAAQIIRRMGM